MGARTTQDGMPARDRSTRHLAMGVRLRRAARLLPALLLAACSAALAPEPENLVVVSFDGLRADRLGVYGNDVGATPQLDGFAASATLFERAVTPAGHSVPAHASLLTSTHPATHGVWSEAYHNGVLAHPKLAPAAETLAELLRDAGFATAAVTSGAPLTASRGLLQGFDFVDAQAGSAHARVDAALGWLERRDTARPFFLFLHIAETDAPYLPPEPALERFSTHYRGVLRAALSRARDWQRRNPQPSALDAVHHRFFRPLLAHADDEDRKFLLALHDAEISLADSAFGRLLARLESDGLDDDTLVVATGSYGAEFLEHGADGQQQLYREVVHVPLLLRAPGAPAGLRRAEAVGLIDVMPTALTALGLAVPEAAEGRAIDLASDRAAPERLLISETAPTGGRWTSIWGPALHAVLEQRTPERGEVYDLHTDAAEAHDLSGTETGAAFLTRSRQALVEHHALSQRRREHFALAPRFGD